MTQTTLTRSGSFDPAKLNALESQLSGLPKPLQVYGTPTGLMCIWPEGLTAPQQTQAQSIINAYTQATDTALLPKQIQQAVAYLNLANPTLAQSQAALRGLLKWALAKESGRDKIDGTDVS